MLRIRELTKIYPGPTTAVSDLDLDVAHGMFGLLGPNGAGKTTLMRMIAGLLEPTSGSIELDGEDIVADPSRVWSRLGYLPQEFGFYPHLSGKKMLLHLLRLKGIDLPRRGLAELADELLDRVNLVGASGRKVGTYSGGMRQRLGIAQAIAGNPGLIIVDEPTAGLDPEERRRFYRLLAELAEERAVLLSTHIVEDVAVLCPRFVILRQGRMVADTTPRAAREAISGRVFEAIVERSGLAAVEQEHRVTQSVLFEGRHQVRIFEPSGVRPAGFEAVPASLEDAYLVAMTGGPATEDAAVAAVATGGGA